jgi:hypothetical protein
MKKVGLLLAAAAAYGAYRLSKMTPEEKNNLKTKGRNFLNKNFGGLNDLMAKKKANVSGNDYL